MEKDKKKKRLAFVQEPRGIRSSHGLNPGDDTWQDTSERPFLSVRC